MTHSLLSPSLPNPTPLIPGQDFADFVPLFRNMGSGRRSFSAGRPPASSGIYGPSARARGSSDGYMSGHVPASYSMPFGLPPPVHRTPLSRDSAEFAWPAEPPSPHGPPRSYSPSTADDIDVAAVAAAAAAGADAMPADADTPASASAAAAEPPHGNLLFGFGGMSEAEALAAVRLVAHRALVDAEHLRLEYAMAAMDAAGARTRRHWRRVSRLVEAEAWVGEQATKTAKEEEEEGTGGSGNGGSKKRAGRSAADRLTGLHRSCQWKLAGNEHEGHEPGRFRPVLQPVLAAAQGSRFLQQSSVGGGGGGSGDSNNLAGSTMSMEDVGLQLARKCSRYIVDIVKTEAEGDGFADGGGIGDNGVGGAGDGDDNDDSMDGEDDVWGVIGPLTPAGITPDEANASGIFSSANAAGGGDNGNIFLGKSENSVNGDNVKGIATEPRIGIVEEVSSSGETPAARAQREEAERRLVEERVRQVTAAVASRGGAVEAGASGGTLRGSTAGPRVNLGPGADRWRRAVAVATEAVSSTTGVSEMVMLVSPKGNCRGRLSLVDKVRGAGRLCDLRGLRGGGEMYGMVFFQHGK